MTYNEEDIMKAHLPGCASFRGNQFSGPKRCDCGLEPFILPPLDPKLWGIEKKKEDKN
jgi:hypothetical protein